MSSCWVKRWNIGLFNRCFYIASIIYFYFCSVKLNIILIITVNNITIANIKNIFSEENSKNKVKPINKM